MSIFLLGLFFLSAYFTIHNSFDKQPVLAEPVDFTTLPSLPRAWFGSAAWSLGCIGCCALLWWWASENDAFEFGDQGQEHLLLLILTVLTAVVLFHKQAYKAFQGVYLARGASRQAGYKLAQAWLLLLSLVRVGWILAILSLVLMLMFKGSNTNAGWQ